MGDLEEITQKFVADVTQYVAEMQAAAGDAQKFAAANVEAKAAVDGVRDSAAEASGALDDLFAHSDAVNAAQGRLRDSALEAATALGRERDGAVEASAAMHELRDAEAETAAAGVAASGGGISMMAAGITALVGLIAAVAPAAVAAGAGLGALAIFAGPVIAQVAGAYQQIGKDQQAYDRALTATARSNALKHLQQDWAALPAPVAMVVKEVMNLKAQWQQLSGQFQMPVANRLSQVIGIVSDLLPKLVPLAQATLGAVGQALNQVGNAVSSPQFAAFLKMLTDMAGPSISAFTRLAGVILGIFGQALTQLAPMSVPFVNMLSELLKAASPALVGALKLIAMTVMDIGKAITPLLGPLGKVIGYMAQHPIFAQMAAAIIGIVAAFKAWTVIMGIFDAVADANPFVLIGLALVALAILIATHTHQIAQAFDAVRHTVASWGHDIANVFDGVRHDISGWGNAVETAFDKVRHAIASWGHDVASTFDTVRHAAAVVGDAIAHPFEAAADWIARNWKNVAAWLLNPIAMAVFEIRTHLKTIEQAFTQLGHDIAVIFDGARHDIAAIAMGIVHDAEAQFDAGRHQAAVIFDGWRHDIAAIVVGIPGDIRKAWDTVRHDAAALGDDVLRVLSSAWTSLWHNLTSATSSGASQVGGFFQKLPGQVLGFLKSLPGDMLSIGENIIIGLYNGIVRQFNAVIGEVKNLAHDISSAFTNPLSIFSPSRVFFEHGANIVRGAINGVKAYAPQLTAAVRGLGTGIGSQGLGSAYAAGAVGPGGGSTTHVTVPVTVQAGAAGAVSPQYLQGLQSAVQEAVLRYNQLNPGNGLNVAWGRG